MSGTAVNDAAQIDPVERAREQRGWYWYDFANSAFVTTTATVLAGPYLTAVAKTAACGTSEGDCAIPLRILGIDVSAGSLYFYAITLTTILSAFVLPVVGAIADRSARKKRLLAGFAWAGSFFAALLFFVTGGNWQLGVVAMMTASLCLGASLVVYDAILIEIATPDERDRVSSRGWAFGYVGGAVLLIVNFGVLFVMEDQGVAARVCMLSAAIWWAGFTFVPFLRLRNRPPVNVEPLTGGTLGRSFTQLWHTLKHARAFPMTLLFLVAYLFFNDGVQTVIYASSVYGAEELGFENQSLFLAILVVQIVAIFGALLLGRLAYRHGAKRVILGSIVAWVFVIIGGFLLPAGSLGMFLALAAAIGLVLGGTQALSRSLYSQLIPRGREAEYFSLYQAMERGTSWLGTLAFGIAHQVTGSYRVAIILLIVFFVVGGLILTRVDVRRGIADAGNAAPAVL
ncbi:MAG: MFS transporter [Actinobacteria bacterium]|nr:MFS transporter [Actinomycetota bacterium]